MSKRIPVRMTWRNTRVGDAMSSRAVKNEWWWDRLVFDKAKSVEGSVYGLLRGLSFKNRDGTVDRKVSFSLVPVSRLGKRAAELHNGVWFWVPA